MKKAVLILTVTLIYLSFGTGYAFQFGPLEPTAKEGRGALNAGYSYNNSKWEGANDDYSTSRQMAYVQGAYTFVKNWEVYARMGMATLKVDDLFAVNNMAADFKDNSKFFGGIGVKGIVYHDKIWGFGPFMQANYYSDYKDTKSVITTTGPGTWDAKWKRQWDFNIGFGFQAKTANAFVVYGAPFLYWAQADVDSCLNTPGAVLSRSYSFKEKNVVGGMLGFRALFTKNFSFDVEGQFKSRFSIGASFNYAF